MSLVGREVQPSPSGLRLFISHSSTDKTFVRKLDAALSFNGISVFLDDRDIAIGDSIPAKIYEGISQASHLIYVISSRSVASRWVQEELDVAKMRQNQDAGFKVLPVLIEDCSLPRSIMHMRYADFRGWENEGEFSRNLSSVLDAIGVSAEIATMPELMFLVENRATFARAEARVFRLAGFLDGAICTALKAVFDSSEAGRIARKSFLRNFIDQETKQSIEAFQKHLDRFCEVHPAGAVRNLSEIHLKMMGSIDRLDDDTFKYCTNLEALANRVGGVMQKLRKDTFDAMSARYRRG